VTTSPKNENNVSKRQLCNKCVRPINVCLCSALLPVFSAVDIVILQDKREAKHPLSTVPIINGMLQASRVFVGEVFDPNVVFDGDENWRENTCLIYPREDAQALNAKITEQIPIKRIVLLDGTWRKAKRIGYLNPWLQQLRAFKITQPMQGRYTIRKAPSPDAYSTLEALVATLEVFSPSTEGELMLTAFEKMIDFQIKAMGEHTFKNNYK
jgi:DTW domain-containing protein YfiP